MNDKGLYNKGLTVITGPNESGKTRLIEKIKKQNSNFIVLDSDSHSKLNKYDLLKFADNLKEKSKTSPVIIASLRSEIINIADKVITLKKK